MAFEYERRRHRRYPLRLSVKLHRGEQVIDADIVNASVGGCLLATSMRLDPGDIVEASTPSLQTPPVQLLVVRSHLTSTGWMVAACFEQSLFDEESLAQLAGEEEAPPRAGPKLSS